MESRATETSPGTPPPDIPVKIATINIENLKSNSAYIRQLLTEHDFICIQEHWLYNFERNIVHNFIPDCQFAIKCSDDDDPLTPLHKPKGVAGVAIIWNQENNHAVTILPDGSPRTLAIQIQTTKGKVTLINSYMPAEGSHDRSCDYPSLLDEVYELTEKFGKDGILIWAGDLNGSFIRPNPTKNDRALRKFCTETGYSSRLASTQNTTYSHFNGTSTSQIDHIMTIPEHDSLIIDVSIDENPINVSPHSAVIIKLDLGIAQEVTCKTTEKPLLAKARPNWKKADHGLYKQATEERLESLINTRGETCQQMF